MREEKEKKNKTLKNKTEQYQMDSNRSVSLAYIHDVYIVCACVCVCVNTQHFKHSHRWSDTWLIQSVGRFHFLSLCVIFSQTHCSIHRTQIPEGLMPVHVHTPQFIFFILLIVYLLQMNFISDSQLYTYVFKFFPIITLHT